jgi:hypothetical protein
MKRTYNSSFRPEYRKPQWQKNDFWNGGSVELHFDAYGRREFVRRNIWGDAIRRSQPRFAEDEWF